MSVCSKSKEKWKFLLLITRDRHIPSSTVFWQHDFKWAHVNYNITCLQSWNDLILTCTICCMSIPVNINIEMLPTSSFELLKQWNEVNVQRRFTQKSVSIVSRFCKQSKTSCLSFCGSHRLLTCERAGRALPFQHCATERSARGDYLHNTRRSGSAHSPQKAVGRDRGCSRSAEAADGRGG